jgi:hypothetical protein
LGAEWAYLALSFDRVLYIGPHVADQYHKTMPVFHTSYLAGVPVQFAGSIHIVEGIVRGVANDSGHYHPNAKFFVNILAQLKTVGVNLKTVKLYDYEGNEIMRRNGKPYRADHYLAEKGNWEFVLERGAEYLLDSRQLRIAEVGKKMFKRIYPRDNPSNLTESFSRQPQSATKENLTRLAVEQFILKTRKLPQGEVGGQNLWVSTWRGICYAMIVFMQDDDKSVQKERKKWEQWKRTPPTKPPRPRGWAPYHDSWYTS